MRSHSILLPLCNSFFRRHTYHQSVPSLALGAPGSPHIILATLNCCLQIHSQPSKQTLRCLTYSQCLAQSELLLTKLDWEVLEGEAFFFFHFVFLISYS
jgi:hypothetical protein